MKSITYEEELKGSVQELSGRDPLGVTPDFPRYRADGLLCEVAQELPELEVLRPGQVGEDQDRSARVGLPDQRGQTQGAANLRSGQLHDHDVADREPAVQGQPDAGRAQLDGAPVDDVGAL